MSEFVFTLRLKKRTASAVALAAGVVGTTAAALALIGFNYGGNDVLRGAVFGAASASAAAAAMASGTPATTPSPDAGAAATPPAPPTLELTETQAAAVKVASVGEHVFPRERQAVGNIDFDQDRNVQVFPPYQGLILQLFAKVGDSVKQGQTLFTIQSPDLIQAESALIAAAGVLDLTSRALARARQLYGVQGIAQKDLEQAISDQQTAEGNLRAARDAVRVFGKNDDEIDRMVKARRIDPALVVPAPISGQITARNAAPGDLVQPGTAPAPYSMADISTVWMLAYVPESDSALYRLGQKVKVSVMAYPGRVFEGKITTVGATVDPNTHRLMTRSAIEDPNHDLRPGMFATFVISIGSPINATAVPLDAVVREPDGTMTVWVTTDKHHFTQRIVTLGMQHDGYDQILTGLKPGELVASDGAIFLSGMLAAEGSAG